MSSQKSLAIGVSQTGKSTFALSKTLALARDEGKALIIWDGNEVFIDIVKSPVYTPEDLREALAKGEPVIVYDASRSPDRFEEFDSFAQVLEDYDNHTLLVDEAGDIQTAQRPNPGLDRLYRRAGRRNNDIMETTHRPQQVAVLNRSLTTDIYLFGITRGKDVKAIADEFSEDVALEAEGLPDYVFIHWHSRTGDWEKVDDPQSWYVDLGRLLPEREPVKVEGQRRPIFSEYEAY